MTQRLRDRIVTGVAVAAGLVAINIGALILGPDYPGLVFPAVALDLGGLALLFWLARRQSQVVESVFESHALEHERESARARATLEDAEARFAGVLDSAMDAVITIDESQSVVLFNQAAEQMFGCARGEALGRPLDRFLPERFRPDHRRHVAAFGEAGVTTRRMGHNTVLSGLRCDGAEFPIEASISKTGAAGEHLYTVILRDITRRVEAEDALRRSERELREIAARVLDSREDEKRHIARELHDELGQQLTALKMDLAWIREQSAQSPPEFASRLSDMNSVLDSTVSATRRIATDLRPLMLDDLGLADAAEWLVDDFRKRSGLDCEFAIREADAIGGLELRLATALYRILQESLTNVARHAQARQVRVVLGLDEGAVTLLVEDDGRGISASDLLKNRSFGLKGVRERAFYLGGKAEVGPGTQGGTVVSVRLPLEVRDAA